MGTAAPNGMNIFPLSPPTQPIPAEFLEDTVVQLLALIAAECAPVSGGSQASATFTGLTTFPGSTTINASGILTTSAPVISGGGTLSGTFNAASATFASAALTSATLSGLTTFPGSTTVNASGILATSNAALTSPILTSASVVDGTNIALGSGSGTQIGTASTQKLGFFGTTPVVQPTAPPAAINSASITSASPFGFTSAIATSVLVLINALRSSVLATGIVGGP